MTTTTRSFAGLMARFVAPLAAIGLCVLLTGCSDSGAASTASNTTPVAQQNSTPPPAATPADNPAADATPKKELPAGTPVLTFDKLVHNFGDVVDTEKYTTSFPFRNTGTGRLVIQEVKAACGCTVPTLNRYSFNPGEGDEIKIVFDPKGKQGETPKYISVLCNAANAESGVIKLKLESMIKPLVEYQRMQRLGNLPLGREYRHRVDLLYTDPNLEFTSLSVNNDKITADLVESGVDQGDGNYKAVVEVVVAEDAPWGLLYATRLNMKVKGRPLPEKPPVSYSYDAFLSGSIYGQLAVQPPIISFRQLKPGEEFEVSASLSRSSAEPLELYEARIAETNMPGINVRFERVTSDSYKVIVFGKAAPGHLGSIRGRVAVKTNVPGEEEIEIRFAGHVKR